MFVRKVVEIGVNPLADNRETGDMPSRKGGEEVDFQGFDRFVEHLNLCLWVALCRTAWWRRDRSDS